MIYIIMQMMVVLLNFLFCCQVIISSYNKKKCASVWVILDGLTKTTYVLQMNWGNSIQKSIIFIYVIAILHGVSFNVISIRDFILLLILVYG